MKKVILFLLSLVLAEATLCQQKAPTNLLGYRNKVGETFYFTVTGAGTGRIWGGQDAVYTDDSPLATAVVHCGLLKAGETGNVYVKIMPGQSSYPSINRNGVNSIAYGSWQGSYKIISQMKDPNVLAQPDSKQPVTTIARQAPQNLTEYRFKTGETFLFTVTGTGTGRIWGGQDAVYTDDSPLATAVVHCGLLKAGETGNVYVKIMPGQRSYPSINRNGVNSIAYGSWEGSYQVLSPTPAKTTIQPVTKPPATTVVTSTPSTLTGYRNKVGQTFTFTVTGVGSGRIWGGQNLIYTDDSPLAVAAVHSGALRAGETGEVSVEILSGQSSYPSINRNGITSIAFGSWLGSYKILMGRVDAKNTIPSSQVISKSLGTFQTDFGEMKLTKDGNTVKGTYNYKDGRIEGILNDRTLTGMWYQSNGRGRIVFVFNNDFSSFAGKWSYNDAAPSATWNGRK